MREDIDGCSLGIEGSDLVRNCFFFGRIRPMMVEEEVQNSVSRGNWLNEDAGRRTQRPNAFVIDDHQWTTRVLHDIQTFLFFLL